MSKSTGACAISEAARKAGLSAKTIRYYESIGLIPKATRRAAATGGRQGSRLYGEVDIGRLRFIRQARDVDFSLAEIRELLKVADAGCPSTQPAYATILRRHMRRVEERINRLLALRSAVHGLLRRTNGTPGDCCAWENCGCMHPEPGSMHFAQTRASVPPTPE